MPYTCIELTVQGANALQSDLILGAPGPASIQLYLEYLGHHGPLPLVAFSFGIRDFVLDAQGRTLNYTRTATDSFTIRKGTEAHGQPYYDMAMCSYKIAILVETAKGLTAEERQDLYDLCLFSPFCGGVVSETRVQNVVSANKAEALRGYSVLVDHMPQFRALQSHYGLDARTLWLAWTLELQTFRRLMNMKDKKVLAQVEEQFNTVFACQREVYDQLDKEGWCVPVHLGFRAVSPVASRINARDGLPHQYVETVSGVAQYVTGKAQIDRPCAWIKKAQGIESLIFIMEGEHHE